MMITKQQQSDLAEFLRHGPLMPHKKWWKSHWLEWAEENFFPQIELCNACGYPPVCGKPDIHKFTRDKLWEWMLYAYHDLNDIREIMIKDMVPHLRIKQ